MTEDKARPGRPAEAWALAELAALEKKGLRRSLETVSSPQGVVLEVSGEKLVSFSSNDYLGLAADPRLSPAWASAPGAGSGAGASRLVVGTLPSHEALERDLAARFSVEGALFFGSGYAANVGALSALVGYEDVLFSDAHNHASLIDGCRLSKANVVVYPHGDLAALEVLVAKNPGKRRFVVTDAVFSMDGDVAKLEGLCALCEKHKLGLYVDEAHAFGVLGENGRGACEAAGVESRVDVRMVTFGKSAGTYGAATLSSKAIRELLVNKARSFVFSTAPPPPLVAAASRGVELSLSDASRRQALWRNVERFAAGLSKLGFPARAESPIFAVVLGPPERAIEASARLRRKGFLVKAIRPPTVPPGTSRLRFSLSASHEMAQIDAVISALAEVLNELP